MNTLTTKEILSQYQPNEEYPGLYHQSDVIDAMEKFHAQFRESVQPRWVKASEKLPPINTKVIIKDSDGKVYDDESPTGWDKRVTNYEWLDESVQPVSGISVEEMAINHAEKEVGIPNEDNHVVFDRAMNSFISGYQSNTAQACGYDISELESEITRLQEKYDENGYDCSPLIKLQRIEQHVDMALENLQSLLGFSREQMEFLEYCQNARDKFTEFISTYECKADLKTEVDSLLICFDQIKERLSSLPSSTDVNNISQQGEQ